MSNIAPIKWIQNLWHILVNDAKAGIVEYAEPAIEFIKANGGTAILSLAESVLAKFVANESWALIVADLIKEAETAGHDLSEGAASAVLNFAKSNIIAKAAGAHIDAQASKESALS